MFGGDDPVGWIFKAEKYFFVNQVRMEDMVKVTSVCMEGAFLVATVGKHLGNL